jgi:hypothetical protein
VHGNRPDVSVEEKVIITLGVLFNVSVKSGQIMLSPTAPVPKLLQLQRPQSTSGDATSNLKENGLSSPRRSFDSSSGSIRSDSISIHPLKYTWVTAPP